MSKLEVCLQTVVRGQNQRVGREEDRSTRIERFKEFETSKVYACNMSCSIPRSKLSLLAGLGRPARRVIKFSGVVLVFKIVDFCDANVE